MADLGLDADGVTFPPAMTERQVASAALVRRDADAAGRRYERHESRRRDQARERRGAASEPVRPWVPGPLPPVRPVPPATNAGPVCEVCHRPLADALVPHGRHFLC
ncbi:hypothetical protein ACFZBU_45355 [Embleya sp. NPDC008237]|uniref:hypothetical protein n=1 Tax=Embleya sp. NPDC008237 TaxID=3363978 RepID=UPI0036E51006